MPLVTVVVPTRNRPRLLQRTLQSILAQQALADLEVIVVDDGSWPNGAPEPATDARVRVVRHQTRAGVAAARNRGIALARGRWIAFCDDDDVWAPDKLVRQLEVARTTGASWI